MRIFPLFVSLALTACVTGEDAEPEPELPEGGGIPDSALVITRQKTVDTIRNVATARGITNGLLIAGIANAETNLSHCRADYIQQLCRQTAGTPVSPSCGGGSVLVGNADSSCDQGGLGLFQIDYGTQNQTIAHYGARVLSLDGNIDIGVTHILEDLWQCSLTPSWGSDRTVALGKAVAWLNNAKRGTADYNTFFMCMSRHYNGAGTQAQANYYKSKTEEVFQKYGAGGGGGGNATIDTDGSALTVRQAPSTTSAAVGSLPDGTAVTITCQTRGESVTGKFGTTDLWDKVGNGYVSDSYVSTGSDGQVAPTCQ